jgi:hypothetical protein
MRRLKLAFAEPARLAAEFQRNIAKGGAQIPSGEPFELREFVEVQFSFDWRNETLVFEAEVVFCGAGMVAVQFRKSAAELRADLSPYLSSAKATASAKPGARAKLEAGAKTPPSRAAPPLFDDESEAGRTPLPQAPDPRGKTVLRVPRDAAPEQPIDPLGAVADRRKAARAVARVPARLASSQVSLEGRTRDLSETGALISADASDLPVGKTVELELQHPESGERLTVRGKVSRHVEAEGTVAAVGLQFDPPPDRARELRNFVNDVKRAESERARTGISGRIEELGIANLIQMLGQSSPLGTLTATHGAEEATIAFENGAVRYALLGSLRGVKALSRVLRWTEGTFAFARSVDGITDEGQPIALQSALLEAARQVDESTRGTRLDMRTRFSVDRAAVARSGDLSKLEEAVLDLAAAGLTVRRMVDVIPDSDGAVQEAIRSLLERGVLAPRA